MKAKRALFLIIALITIFAGCIKLPETTTPKYPAINGKWDFSVKTGNNIVDTASEMLTSMTTTVTFLEPDSKGDFSGTLKVYGMDAVPVSGSVTESGNVTIKYDPVILKKEISIELIGKAIASLKLVSTLNGTINGNNMSGTGNGSTKVEVKPELFQSAAEYMLKDYMITTSAITWTATKQ